MAASGKKNMFNESTRVQMPAMVHLTRLGYTYFGKITEDMAGTVYDPDTNILINIFKEQFARLNPTHAGEAEQTLKTIRQELDNDDIGRSFYERLSSVLPQSRVTASTFSRFPLTLRKSSTPSARSRALS